MQNAFRRRFGNALQWYQVLEQQMNHEVDSWVQAISSSHRDQTKSHDEVSNTISPADLPRTSHSASTHNPLSLIQPSTAATAATEVLDDKGIHPEIGTAEGTADRIWRETCTPRAFPLPLSDSTRALDRRAREECPSPYLTRRCPVCFSTSSAQLDHSRYVIIMIQALHYLKDHRARAIVCLDANFSQRRRHSKYQDPKLLHPDTYWISPEDVKKMEVEVEAARTGIKREVTNATHVSTDMQDIPDEVYNDCQKTFTAAQNISKASNKIFADTAIMALVCRHDCPLLLVNMTSPGERQHYALALLHELFGQLPNDWHIGLLYDIACQLRRSMQKVCVILINSSQ
jgi:hypothetical protein